jgi:hypothetical protein
MPRQVPSASVPIYQVKVTLRGSKPPIWRRILVASDTRLGKLHRILQVVMGWTDSHLHQFMVGHTAYGVPDPDFDLDVRSERTVPLSRVLQAPKDKIIYEYDFGDSWEHELLLEKVLAPDPAIRYPICVTGKRACPPEDCGGIWGYAELLEALASPNHPEHASMRDWVGDDFEPEAFDLEAVNSMLRQIR